MHLGRWTNDARSRALQGGSVDWQEVLDLDLALRNCRTDITGDWYRDPWGWPEMDWVVTQRPDVAITRLNGAGARFAAEIDVPKENFGNRPALVLDPVDRLIYQAIVDSLSSDLAENQEPWVYGWRLPQTSTRSGRYSRNSLQWLKLISAINTMEDMPALLKADIFSFFSSVDLKLLTARVGSVAGETAVTTRLSDLLQAWSRIPSRHGLPQRSGASAVLANFYLAPIDEVLSRHGGPAKNRRRSHVFRWMDDIWLFGLNDANLRLAQLDIQDALLELGLEINLAKTFVHQGADVGIQVRSIDHRNVDYGVSVRPRSPQALEDLDELINRLVGDPEHANRTSVRFATTRMRKNNLYRRLEDFVEVAHRMPHAADSIARLFRDSGSWNELQTWFLEYASGPFGRIDWSVSQFGTMFPADKAPSIELEEYFAHLLLTTQSLAVTALVSQRLASWTPEQVLPLLREAAETSRNPMRRRVIALASLQAGEARGAVRRMLSEFEENRVTLDMLDDRGFKPLKLSADYRGTKRRS